MSDVKLEPLSIPESVDTLINIENVRQLQDGWPSATGIPTGNAEENVSMLRVNEAMGFRPDYVTAMWKLTLQAGRLVSG
jgi:hypothetical protein